MPDGTWSIVGTSSRPLYLRDDFPSWRKFAGAPTGDPLALRLADNSWQTVAHADPVLGSIHGTVRNPNGRALPQRLVTAEFGFRNIFGRTVSAADGSYTLRNLPLKDYTVWVQERTTNHGDIRTLRDIQLDVVEDWMYIGQDYTTGFHNWPGSTSGLIAPTGWYARTLDTTMDNGDHTIQRSGDRQAAPITAHDISATGWIGDANNTHSKYTDQQYGWYALDLPLYRDITLQYLARLNQSAGAQWEDLELHSAEVTMFLDGFSVVKNALPWWNFYRLPDTNASFPPPNGVGVLYYQGQSTDTAGPYTWTGNVNNFDITQTVDELSAVVGKPAEWETYGTALWGDNLNNLGTDAHGFNRPSLEIKHTIPAEDLDGGIQYHWHTSLAPPPYDIDKEHDLHITFHNEMTVDFALHLNFHYLP